MSDDKLKKFSQVTEDTVQDIKKYKPVGKAYKESVNSFRIIAEKDYALSDIENVLETVVQKGFTARVARVKANVGMEIQVIIEYEETVEDLVIEALGIDGGHHKQWYLNQIAEKLGLSHPPDRFEQGIPP